MKSLKTQLIHNPGAGFSDYTRKALLEIFLKENWEVIYSSTKKNWEIDKDSDIVLIAGGDGTVRKVVAKMADWPNKPVLGVLPIGTANNIGTSLGLDHDIRKTLRAWKKNKFKTRAYDLGYILQPIDGGFFLESVGTGLFPNLMKAMAHKKNPPVKNRTDSINNSLRTLHEVSLTYEPHYAYLQIEEQIYSGLFLWIEIMNMTLMGPNLIIAPKATSNDNLLDVVMVKEEDREKISTFIESNLKGNPIPFPIRSIKTPALKLQWYGNRIHVDDDLIDFPNSGEMSIGIKSNELKFLVTA